MSEGDRPNYLASLPPAPDDELWRRMEARFHDLKDIVLNCRVETYTQALGKKRDELKRGGVKWGDTAPKWHDDNIGTSVRAWNLIPFVAAVDQADIEVRLEFARDQVDVLEKEFKRRIASPAFLSAWGGFCAAAGTIEFIYLAQPGDMSRVRVRASGLAAQKTWVARVLLDQMAKGRSRADAEAELVARIRTIVSTARFAPDFPREWFDKIVTRDGGLRKPFAAAGHFPKDALKIAAKEDWEVPETRL